MAGLMRPEIEKNGPAASEPERGSFMESGNEPDTASDEGGEAATPEEQAQYDALVTGAYELMYADGEVRPTILEFLDENPEDLRKIFGEALPLDEPADPNDPEGPTIWEAQGPVIALAATTVIILLEVLRQGGNERPEGYVILHAGTEILEDIAEISEKAGKHTFTQEEMGEALRKGADLFREAAAEEGMIDLDQVKAEFGEVVDADKQGRLGDVVPGLSSDSQVAPDQRGAQP